MAPFESARLPWQCCGDGLRALGADFVVRQVERGQRGAEKPNRNKESSISRLVRIGSSSGWHHSKARAYLGNAAAMAFAPSVPIRFCWILSLVNGALKNSHETRSSTTSVSAQLLRIG